jgi:hypothetical protein
MPTRFGGVCGFGSPLTYRRIADARGSDQSRDRQGALACQHQVEASKCAPLLLYFSLDGFQFLARLGPFALRG